MIFDNNCTVVTGLFDIERHLWSSYNRDWDIYWNYFCNILSLKAKMVIFIQQKNKHLVEQERMKIDPTLENTVIIEKEIEELKKFELKDQIENTMNSDQFKNGLVESDVPEICKPLYSIVILSKLDLLEESIKLNKFDTKYFMWLDGGICHTHYKEEHKNIDFPKIENFIPPDEKITLLCRQLPQPEDANMHMFFKSHSNRFGAGLILGDKTSIPLFNKYCDIVLKKALDENVIDCEQSIYAIVYLQNPELFNLFHGDWYDLFYKYC